MTALVPVLPWKCASMVVDPIAMRSTTIEAHFQGKTGTSAVMVTP